MERLGLDVELGFDVLVSGVSDLTPVVETTPRWWLYSGKREAGKCTLYFSPPPKRMILTLEVTWGDGTEEVRKFFPRDEGDGKIIQTQPKALSGDWKVEAVFKVGEMSDVSHVEEQPHIQCTLDTEMWTVSFDSPDSFRVKLERTRGKFSEALADVLGGVSETGVIKVIGVALS